MLNQQKFQKYFQYLLQKPFKFKFYDSFLSEQFRRCEKRGQNHLIETRGPLQDTHLIARIPFLLIKTLLFIRY